MGESKLCHKRTLSEVLRMRLPLSSKSRCTEESEDVLVAQRIDWSASVKMRLPFLRRESFESLPLMGWSRLASQTRLWFPWEEGLVNQIARP